MINKITFARTLWQREWYFKIKKNLDISALKLLDFLVCSAHVFQESLHLTKLIEGITSERVLDARKIVISEEKLPSLIELFWVVYDVFILEFGLTRYLWKKRSDDLQHQEIIFKGFNYTVPLYLNATKLFLKLKAALCLTGGIKNTFLSISSV